MPQEIVLINPDTRKAEAFTPDLVQGAYAAGYLTPINDPSGNATAAPFGDARSLLSGGAGYSLPSPEQLQSLMDVAKYDTPMQQAAAFVEGVAEGIAPGIAPALETAAGFTTMEDIAKRGEIHSGTKFAGNMTGLVAGGALLPSASLPGLVSKAGKAAMGAVELTGKFGTIARVATQGAVEGALFEAAHQLNEQVIGNPKENGEAIAAHIGGAALMGGGFNLAIHGIAQAAGLMIKKGSGLIGMADDPRKEMNNGSS